MQALSQDFAKVGRLFWKLEATINELDPNFHQFSIRLRRFFCQNQVIFKKKRSSPKLKRFFLAEIRWSPKKKGLHQNSVTLPDQLWVSSKKRKLYFSGPNNSTSFTTSAPQFRWGGGAVFIFGAKICLKSTKNALFYILFRPMGGCYSPPPLAPLLLLCMFFIFDNIFFSCDFEWGYGFLTLLWLRNRTRWIWRLATK